MTAPGSHHPRPDQTAPDQTPAGEPPPPAGWRWARPELSVAVVAVAAAAAAGYALAGPRALTVVLVVAAAAALVALRWLLPPPEPLPAVQGGADTVTTGWSAYRYWRTLSDLRDGVAARAAYEMRLRPALEHLLAARLAERHGINLYTDPAQARRLLCRAGRDDDLWAWIDPSQADSAQDDLGQTDPEAASGRRAGAGPEERTDPRTSRQQPGIPRRTLERLVNRLEQL